MFVLRLRHASLTGCIANALSEWLTCLFVPQRHSPYSPDVTNKPKKDRAKENLLRREEKEKENASVQKHECGCPSLQTFLRS